MAETQTFSMYTTGESLTPLLQSFILEGSYYTAYEILKDGGLPDKLIKEFFLQKGKFVGDTREDNLSYVTIKNPKKVDIGEILYTGIRTIMSAYKGKNKSSSDIDRDDLYYTTTYVVEDFLLLKEKDKNLKTLFKVFTVEEVVSFVFEKFIRTAGFEIASPNDEIHHGVILSDGTFIKTDYDEHKYLVPLLYKLGLATSSDEYKDRTCLMLSSRQLKGLLSNAITHPLLGNNKENKVTDAQLHTLFNFRKQLYAEFGTKRPIVIDLYRNISETENNGAKFAYIKFLQKYYPHIKTPRISKSFIDGVTNFVRTSPQYSMPGLLESKIYTGPETITEIEDTFKNIIASYPKKYNKLFVFYQEFLKGKNGVCHINDSEFSYAVSSNQGDIVNGKRSSETISKEAENVLKKWAEELYADFKTPLQIEFIVNGDDVVLIQMRTLEVSKNIIEILKPDVVYASGLSFSNGEGVFDVKDVLVVKQDTKAQELLDKKALIVIEDVSFSHILALSLSLGIPSMYAMGENFKLPEEGKIKFTAINKEAWIEKV